MSLPAIIAARRFDVTAPAPFFIGEMCVGWIRLSDLDALRRWPQTFDMDTGAGDAARAVRLSASLTTVEVRTAALAAAIDTLHAEGRIPGWHDETYAIRNAFDRPLLAFIERAASRFFGTMTYAVHLNGIVKYRDDAPKLWIARRSDTKATDPGMLDNVVAGGIGWGWISCRRLSRNAGKKRACPPNLHRPRSAAAPSMCCNRCPKARRPSRSSSTTSCCRSISRHAIRTAKSVNIGLPASTTSRAGSRKTG